MLCLGLWSDRLGFIPREIALLSTIDHPNIVRVVDVLHSSLFFQMVMAQHGPGFDLFEFIDTNPDIEEDLAIYIFRQVSGMDNEHAWSREVVQVAERRLPHKNVGSIGLRINRCAAA